MADVSHMCTTPHTTTHRACASTCAPGPYKALEAGAARGATKHHLVSVVDAASSCPGGSDRTVAWERSSQGTHPRMPRSSRAERTQRDTPTQQQLCLSPRSLGVGKGKGRGISPQQARQVVAYESKAGRDRSACACTSLTPSTSFRMCSRTLLDAAARREAGIPSPEYIPTATSDADTGPSYNTKRPVAQGQGVQGAWGGRVSR